MNSKCRNKGFTLIEVMIAMIILVFISFGIYQAIVQTYQLRDDLTHEGDFHNNIRMAMSILDRDITQIYSPLLMVPPRPKNAPPPDAQELAMMTSGDWAQITEFWGTVLDKTGIRPSRFKGTTSQLSFIATSHIRIYKDAPESELAKVSYEIKPDTDKPLIADSYVLIKSTSPNVYEIDDQKDKWMIRMPLLRGIKKFNFSYFRLDKDQTVSSWDSESESSGTKSLYPEIVQVELEVWGHGLLKFNGNYKFRLEIPFYGLDSTI